MVKAANLTWHSALVPRRCCFECAVTRWGTTSMDVTFTGSFGTEPRFDAVLTYVAVTRGEGKCRAAGHTG